MNGGQKPGPTPGGPEEGEGGRPMVPPMTPPSEGGAPMVPPMTPPSEGGAPMVPPMTPPMTPPSEGGAPMVPPMMPPSGGGAPMMPPPGGGEACPAIACGPEFRKIIPLEDQFDESVGLLIETCHNEFCLSAMLSVARDRLGPGVGGGIEVPNSDTDRTGSPILQVTLFGSETPGTLPLEITWRLWSQMDAQSGDEYSVRVMSASGSELFSETVTVNYERVEVALCTSCLVAEAVDEAE